MDIHELSAKLVQTTSLTADQWLFRSLLRLLAQGEPVTIDDLANATGRPSDQVRQTLSALPDVERDDQGRIVGYGITLRPTPHHFEVNGQRLYTWCALDTLIFPSLLDLTAHIQSPCHGTGIPVRVTVEPTGVTSVEPATAVVSIVTPDEHASIRSAFCDQVHFFASPEAAKGWLDEHPGMTVHPVTEAHQLGQPLVEALLGDRAKDPGCC